MASERRVKLTNFHERVERFGSDLDLEGKAKSIAELETTMNATDFWSDQDKAKVVIGRLKTLKSLVEAYVPLRDGVTACLELLDLAEADGDEASLAEIDRESASLSTAFESLELKQALSGPYDDANVFMSIQAGVGGTDANDWAEMMLRMYSAYFDQRGWKYTVVDIQPGPEAGIKSATLYVEGTQAYGWLKSEMGTHRLVRMSPFNAGGTRETSFAAVEITPELPEADLVGVDDLDPKEFRIDTYRAGGAGGQHVNKTDSAVRITHLATNIVVSCQSERSQVQNRAQCWKMMASKLQQLNESDRLRELKDLQGEKGRIGWGMQIRSYVLQPNQLVTDLRTRLKEGNAQKVLDGDLQPFIEAYLRWRLKQEQGASSS